MGRIEQRKSARFNVEVAAEVYTPEGVLSASTRNLSATGVCVDVKRELKEGTTIGISLFLTSDGIEDPDFEPLNIKAGVIWCAEKDDSNYSAGACFKDLTEANKSTLSEFLSALGA